MEEQEINLSNNDINNNAMIPPSSNGDISENKESSVINTQNKQQSIPTRSEIGGDVNNPEMKKLQAQYFEKYINETGIAIAFQLIFSELITKKIPVSDYYTYTAKRLRDFENQKANFPKNNINNI
jgi:hypothetical protein